MNLPFFRATLLMQSHYSNNLAALISRAVDLALFWKGSRNESSRQNGGKTRKCEALYASVTYCSVVCFIGKAEALKLYEQENALDFFLCDWLLYTASNGGGDDISLPLFLKFRRDVGVFQILDECWFCEVQTSHKPNSIIQYHNVLSLARNLRMNARLQIFSVCGQFSIVADSQIFFGERPDQRKRIISRIVGNKFSSRKISIGSKLLLMQN